MLTTAERLATLNALRAAQGKAPLTSWKESRAKLDEAIAKLTPASALGDLSPMQKAGYTVLDGSKPEDHGYKLAEPTEDIKSLAKFLIGWSKFKPITRPASDISFVNCGKWSTKVTMNQAIMLIEDGLATGTAMSFTMTQPSEQKAAVERIVKRRNVAVEAAKKRIADAAVKMGKTTDKTSAPAPKADHPVGMSVADYCKKFDLNPKIARAKLRKAGVKQINGHWIATEEAVKVLS